VKITPDMIWGKHQEMLKMLKTSRHVLLKLIARFIFINVKPSMDDDIFLIERIFAKKLISTKGSIDVAAK